MRLGKAGHDRIAGALACALACLALGLALAQTHADAGVPSGGVVATAVGGKFDSPVFVSRAPGYERLLFVVEQGGTVRVLRDGVQRKRPFLDISNRVSTGGEQGLLSIAFSPGYRKNRRFYVYYTNRECDAGCDIEVDEFRRARGTALRARRRSRREVITIRHRDAANHNGGTAMFGPDRKLWLATGDGGGSGDTFDNARKRSSLLGKLLRIDPRKPARGRRGYRVPTSNPFHGATPGRGPIWSIGLRNPYRFSFDRARQAIAIGDVGQGAREEVSYVRIADARGANFGWPQLEGDQPFDPSRPGPGPLVDPVHVYPNPAGAPSSVTGGIVARDPRLGGDLAPAQRRYLFADVFDGPLRSFVPALGSGDPDSSHREFDLGIAGPVAFGEDAKRRIHVVGLFADRVYRLDPAP